MRQVTLDDKYALERGRVYLSGTQALVRLPMLQRVRDRAAGLRTAGYVSGYRGSPLAGLDLALWRARAHLERHDVVFQPGLNEDLAATAVWGTQQVNLRPGARVDGVFGMWYGKGPGLDRSADVLKHANSAGTARHGGVLLLAGDDHAAKSSSLAHQSEHLLGACGIPLLYPANVQEYLDYGLHGWAMSRYSGLWAAMKCVTDVVESSASIEVDPERVQIVIPDDFVLPPDGLNIRWPDPPLVQEARMMDYKWYAALAYVRANRLNRVVVGGPQDRFGIMAGGKSWLDVRQALVDLGLDDDDCRRLGIRLFKVGCAWPLEAQTARDFATGLEEILVVEEKRQVLEYALKEELYNWREDVRPRVYGKFDERDHAGGEWSMPRGQWLLPARSELSPALIAKAIAGRLLRVGVPPEVEAGVRARLELLDAKAREASRHRLTVERQPWFCPGCPHNTSTRVPEGSHALAGIGCHYMVLWMDRATETFTQMGGEGASWLGRMHFAGERHMFVNLGDGTYFHSGLLAIRAAIAARANVTYKILFNDAVAMTGGQPVDGVLTVAGIARQVLAEGAVRTVVVSDDPQRHARTGLPADVEVHPREALDALQRALREVQGTTVLIYDQTCAAEKRRRRKRGEFADPPRRAFINALVCEGCGDCSRTSNCLAIEPLDTVLGPRRQINQSACNKDFSCLQGFCPSFVTAEGARLRRPMADAQAGRCASLCETLPVPDCPLDDAVHGIVVTGVGGTGVVTIGALLGMAAHLESRGVTVLDMAGLAQKGGAVLSHIQIARDPGQIHATRIAIGEARLLIGCDAIVAASDEALSRLRKGVTRAVVNAASTPTADLIAQPDWSFPHATIAQDLRDTVGADCAMVDANALAVSLLGDAVYANPLLLGYAWQRGWVPLSEAALLRAIELNAVEVARNIEAFRWGRIAAGDPRQLPGASTVPSRDATPEVGTLDGLIAHRVALLTAYQDASYAARFSAAIARLRVLEQRLGVDPDLPLTRTAAAGLSRLMAYKDEYEVARLFRTPEFFARLRAQFEGEPGRDYRLSYYLAPPGLSGQDDSGAPRKRRFGAWMGLAFALLAPLKRLRGTVWDPFGRSAERRAERQDVEDYFALLERFGATLDATRLPLAIELAALPDAVRGFGHVKAQSRARAGERRAVLLRAYAECHAPAQGRRQELPA